MARARTRHELIARAIKEAGTTATGPVMLKMEDILHEEMMIRQPSYVKSTPNSRMYKIADRLERIGIFTYSDVRALITEVATTRVKERPRRQEEFRQALGM